MITRRSLIGALFAAPAIVRAASLDGLHLLRPTVPSPVLIDSITVTGTSIIFSLDNGETIGPLLLPPAILTPGEVRLIVNGPEPTDADIPGFV